MTVYSYLSVLDGEQDEAVGILLKEGLLGMTSLELGSLVIGNDNVLDGLPRGGVVAVAVIGRCGGSGRGGDEGVLGGGGGSNNVR